MKKTILITGGSGLIGKSLTELLLQSGYEVFHLSRNHRAIPGVKVFRWAPEENEIDTACIQGVQAIVHLAGENIGARPWTNDRKKKIIESRTQSIRLIYNLLEKHPEHQVQSVISASAVGIYGDRGDEILTETSSPGSDFLAITCKEWERAVDEAKGLRVVKLRTGVVLSNAASALQKMDKPVKLGMGSSLGSGKQWMPWIHLDDITALYLFALENETLTGAFNAATSNPLTNIDLTRAIASHLNKSLWAPAVPAFILRVILGHMSAIVLNSTKTSNGKIKEAGFRFKFDTIDQALKNIYAGEKSS
ncbi:TIGR01777 family oxidoreductase [Desertivirga xinjiangensis]|uniref:TIGR01777 family oxidoreductase n=1 Tax=Desertivirga xinjiangensis TaxID=539206 RepID=UPI002109BD13|nr:TIGR01777 family oxidoreductase [Pedobacter xinjiangensis]